MAKPPPVPPCYLVFMSPETVGRCLPVAEGEMLGRRMMEVFTL